ncbi:hypothetical protein BO83DRAFT_408483 [Aspergillus eucalypticola CBS 122712]|uniref:Uncharacterized protein n=1 Tax=Aspergillus eucalypticola (strain CBS 122712 / IBT 29274) TaxID=1448314 RepID=A0A317VH45_ASPEC|nr:uncharacterized protein BO83DRAFT_408483 [Aspergillus eucalypticola CBS 122712]PWY72769.1 hypothetical protein BO83DRAFT_408483 [Aspergillus eucalypticola CBS 122712]
MITKSLLPSWLRIFLMGLSIFSFLPQLRLLWATKNSSGLSINYVLINLICATEQFLLVLLYNNTPDAEPNMFVENPGSLGDWMNLIQITVVWILSGLTFTLSLRYPSDSSFRVKRSAALSYIAYLLVAVVPPVCVVLTTRRGEDPPTSEIEWQFALWSGVHLIFVNPVMTLLSFSAVFCQAPKLLKGVSPPRALSLPGLAIQAVVFTVLALSWPFRFVYLDPDWNVFASWFALYTWYVSVGWTAVDCAVFALVQVILLWLACRNRKHWQLAEDGETEPLLANRR